MSVTYISSLSFDARKNIISALDRVIPYQEFFNFCIGAEVFKFKVSLKRLSMLNGIVKTTDAVQVRMRK